ncbi:hypothetical protein Pst134EA_017229 [Puccinia striiformis f. sp. tritici]|uniref:hypothetical protein n=1 Tax=Puccinia striiformis f. sp. tritici TaxID=168172 RepID=UPI0020084098|nr:hypothetical protein Pst134EA_017229 [Puccinia striiformis f. sp. tritici]KAH9460917.1 hypothetical protein Pst134EA_017229 [Puccinia striiformis f. sp. tritici]
MAPSGQNKPTSESAFRANMSGFKWARGLTDESSNLQPPSTSTSNDTNPFTRFTNSFSGYVPLRSNERSNEEEAYYALSRWERTIGFLMCTTGAMICFIISFFTLPLLAIKPRKFAVSFSLGSILFMIGFMVLQGPIQHLKHIFSTDRLPFTISYLISLFGTLYFAIGVCPPSLVFFQTPHFSTFIPITFLILLPLFFMMMMMMNRFLNE